jgi:hypothetical protein
LKLILSNRKFLSLRGLESRRSNVKKFSERRTVGEAKPADVEEGRPIDAILIKLLETLSGEFGLIWRCETVD